MAVKQQYGFSPWNYHAYMAMKYLVMQRHIYFAITIKYRAQLDGFYCLNNVSIDRPTEFL